MYLENGEPFSPEELRLIEKARHAVRSINHQYVEKRGRWSEDLMHVMDATVFSKIPKTKLGLRLDFKGHQRGKIGEAWVGPQVPLTEDLFDGESLKKELIQQVADHWAEFVAHMKQCATEEKAR